jgi:hypothetical protein
MITGFNTDVKHEGSVYHVQTEARGRDNPVLESLVYIGGTIIAKKISPYADQLRQGATEDAIASLLRRQHQVVIAAIRAGRIDDLIHLSTDERAREAKVEEKFEAKVDEKVEEKVEAEEKVEVAAKIEEKPQVATVTPEPPPPRAPASQAPPAGRHSSGRPSGSRSATPPPQAVQPPEAPKHTAAAQPRSLPAKAQAPVPSTTGGLNLDEVISDYVKRTSEQGRLDLKVISPNSFIAGKSIGLRVQVLHETVDEPGAIVTIKIIGTAFKPQVYLGRTGADGVVSFNLVLPAFSAGTAAIVIEAQSSHGRGELKHLIRRA